MDYEVLLADSREWALDQWQGPEVEKILGLPDDVVREHAADEHCAVITLSHDPRVDDMALMEAHWIPPAGMLARWAQCAPPKKDCNACRNWG